MANSTIITLRIKTEIYDVIKSITHKDDIPISFVIRRAIKRGLPYPPPSTQSATQKTPAPVQTPTEFTEEWE